MNTAAPQTSLNRRLRLAVSGTVQGVGFRPFVQRLASERGLSGWVANSSGGAIIEVQGEVTAVEQFVEDLPRQLPAQARIDGIATRECPLGVASGFGIRPSFDGGPVSLSIPHDLAPCADCLREFHQPGNRRHHYPFISCTACGPRWSLTRALPFDRGNTSFAAFPPCAACVAEYADPADRRCHHQGISCPACGPVLRLVDGKGAVLASGVEAMRLAAARLRAGEIVAVKSVGGFQLLVDARSGAAIARLRQRKGRPAKPLAVMFADLDQLLGHGAIQTEHCGSGLKVNCRTAAREGALGHVRDKAVLPNPPQVATSQHNKVFSHLSFRCAATVDSANAIADESAPTKKPLQGSLSHQFALNRPHCADTAERQALISPQRPIVLLSGKHPLPDGIAPGLASLGALLPPSALHEGLFTHFPHPLVATSGNRSGEPLCYRNEEALARLGDIADCFLLHDLAISQPLDDSVVRVIGGNSVTLRAGRGLAPALLSGRSGEGWIAVGGHQKNTVAVGTPHGIVASPHIGDLSSALAQQRLGDTVARLRPFAATADSRWLADAHPDYGSSQWLADQGHDAIKVQHHVGHFFSVLAEQGHRGPALGVCWDGSGLGSDGRLWGGEFFVWDGKVAVERVAHLRPFPLPGGEAAIREPRRQALGLLWAMGAIRDGEYGATRSLAAEWECPYSPDSSAVGSYLDSLHSHAGMWEREGSVLSSLRASFTDSEWHNLQTLLAKRINSPECTSVGRLIDAVAALLQVCDRNRFEADAAMQLEALAAQGATAEAWPFAIKRNGGCRVIDWQPVIAALLTQRQSRTTAELAAIFHHSLAAMVVAVAEDFPDLPVFLSGGVFQNKYLAESLTARLNAAGRRVYSHQRIPPDDGGLAVGQLYYALHCGGNESCV